MKNEQKSFASGTYGPALNVPALRSILDHVFASNAEADRFGELPVPICIWGTHGIGKTALVREVAQKRGWPCIELAPAQLEELGDLHGLPTRVSAEGNVQEGSTAFLPPTWVPRHEGPGVLLLDDLNRAEERVLRALMQLLQTHRLYSWSLPARWQIVCTANPESGDYQTTLMDDALITRMIHFTLSFDALSWATWAREVRIDPRCIEFVQWYPEVAHGRRTSPRTLVQFFRLVASIPDFSLARERVSQLALATLDPSTAACFERFACEELRALPTAEQILEAETTAYALTRIGDALRDRESNGALRIDRLATVIGRIEAVVSSEGYTPSKRHAQNLAAVLTSAEVPRDLAMRLHRTLSRCNLASIVRSREVAERLLKELPF